MSKVDEDQIRRIDELVRRIDAISDPEMRELTGELMQAVLALHGSGIERMMDLIAESGTQGETLFRHFANDALVASVLVLHGLHPDDLETRVRHVLSKHPAHPELLSVFDGVVRVRVAPGGCNSDETTVQSLEATLRTAIPDAVDVIVQEGVPQGGFVPITALDPFFSSSVLAKG